MTRHVSFFMFAMALVGCGEQGGEHKGPDYATVTGRAMGGDHGRTSAVAVYRIETDGSLSLVSEEDASVEADGSYTVDVSVSDEGERNLIVEASFEDGATLSALISAPLYPGETAEAEPILEETTAEAELTVSLVASGAFDAEDDRVALVRAFVDARLGAAWSEASEAERELVLQATEAATLTWQSSMERDGLADVAFTLYVETLAELSAESAESGDDQAVDALKALIDSSVRAGYSSLDLSLTASAAFEAWDHASDFGQGVAVHAGGELFSEIQIMLMTEAVDEAWGDLGDPVSGEAAEERSDDLLDEVIDLLTGDGSAAEVEEVVEDYASDVKAELNAALGGEVGLDLAQAEAMTMDARAELSASIRAASDQPAEAAEQISEAMATYNSQANIEVAAWLESSGSFDEQQASAVAQILSQLTLTSGE